MRRTSLLVAIVLLVAVAGASFARVGDNCGAATAGDRLRLSVERRADNALIADATVTLGAPAPIYLEYGTDRGWLRTPTTASDTLFQIPLVRLRPSAAYEVRAFALASGDCPAAAAAAKFQTGRLPAQFEQSVVQLAGQPSFPLTLMDYRPKDSRGNSTFWLVVLDQDGTVVWYYEVPRQIMSDNAGRSVIAFAQRANGDLLYIMKEFGFDEITPGQQLVRRMELKTPGATNLHHDFVELPDGRLIIIGATNRRIDETSIGGSPRALVRGDTLHLFDPSTGAEQELWNAFDSLNPLDRPEQYRDAKDEGAEDWTHANSIDLGSQGNLLLAVKNLDQVISFSPDLRSIEWKLGGPGSSFSFPDPTDRFRAQHDIQQLPNGHLLMFDNGLFRPDGDYSRALELELDFGAMTARKVWEYRATPDIFSSVFGNVVRLPNGNTLVNFGWREVGEEPVVAVEVQPDGTVAWQQEVRWKPGVGTNRYRILPLMSLAGETAVEPTPFSSP